MTKLKLARLHLDITQYQLNDATGVPRWKIALAENGHEVLNANERSALANFLGISADDPTHEINFDAAINCLPSPLAASSE